MKGNFGVKKVKAPSTNPKNAPLCVLPQTKKTSSALSESEVHWYFYVPKRERERGRGVESERRETEREGRDREIGRVRARKGKERDKSVGDYISKPPSQSEKIRKLYCTVLYRKERYSM